MNIECTAEAAQEYLQRRRGTTTPSGAKDDDRWEHGKLWAPTAEERRSCCAYVRPDNLYGHCQSAEHVAKLFGVDASDLLLTKWLMEDGYSPSVAAAAIATARAAQRLTHVQPSWDWIVTRAYALRQELELPCDISS